MKSLTSVDFKWRELLRLKPGEMMIVECENYRDYESKANACRIAFKRYPEEFEKIGIGGLKVEKAGTANVLITAQPTARQEPFTDTLLEGDGKQEEEGEFCNALQNTEWPRTINK